MMTLPGSPNWKLRPEFAHPRAQRLFHEPFFWDAIDDHAPWGSDEGADALAFFGRAHDANGGPPNPSNFANDYVGGHWSADPPSDDLPEKVIESFSAGHLEVIAIALGMYLLHGYVTEDIKALGLEAIQRELHPACLNLFREPEERAMKLRICREHLLEMETSPPTPAG